MSTPAGGDVVLEPVAGWRVWRLTSVGGEVRIAAVARGSVWPVRVPMRGRCPEHPDDEVPGADCMCGLYASSSLRALARAGVLANPQVGVVGSVETWGRVVEHDRGTRSALAYPSRMRLVCGACLAERRGPVEPVEVVRRGADLAPVCARHLGPGERGRPAAEVQEELLGAYAVEVLPAATALDGLRHRRGSAAALRLLDAVPRIPERFRTPARGAAAIVTVLALAVALSTEHRPDPPSSAAAAPASPISSLAAAASPDLDVAGQPPAAVPQQQQRLHALICGVVEGGLIQRVASRARHADAFGMTSTPAAPRPTCREPYELYDRERTWSVCWYVDPEALARLER
jgi:hypothetical protein